MKLKSPDCLPDNIHLYTEELPVIQKGGSDYRLNEKKQGQKLLDKMAFDCFGIEKLEIQRTPGQKPTAVQKDGKEFYLGLSHTKTVIAGVLSEKYPVAVDIENSERNIYTSLFFRIRHVDEPAGFYEKNGLLRIWTMKESALKWYGTGLRTPMSSLKIEKCKNNLFLSTFVDGKCAKVCSFKESDHWISVAYGQY